MSLAPVACPGPVEPSSLEFDETELRGADPGIPLRDRIRMGCAFATVVGFVMIGGEAFRDVGSERLVTELKSAVHDLLAPRADG